MSRTRLLKGIARQLPSTPSVDPIAMSGGCIHDCWCWGPYFIKTNEIGELATFSSEAASLRSIAATGAIKVPEPVAIGTTGDSSFLAMERLDLIPTGNEALLGEQLAELHTQTADSFGFHDDNHIGTTPQQNAWTPNWSEFFRDHRLVPLLDLLGSREIIFAESQPLLDRLEELLPSKARPSLLHGDLWGGNKSFLKDGTPVIFDPSCYYGHYVCDLAMTRLFGGFGPKFYDAYRSCSEIEDPSLHEIYNLYHILNHAILFGGGYVTQADSMIRRLART